MDKSQLLDELRLEVGSVPDFAQTLPDFYQGIVEKLSLPLDGPFGVALYTTELGAFQRMAEVGSVPLPRTVPFGEGIFSLAAIRGQLQFVQDTKRQTIVTPFYTGHHLIGHLVLFLPNGHYSVSEEDFIFLRELTRFIENNHKKYLI